MGKTALLVGGSAATGRAIIAELVRRGYDVTLLNRGRHNDGLEVDLDIITADPHFADSIRAGLGSRTWDVAVVTYGRVQLFAEELRGRVGQLVTISGVPVVATRTGIPFVEDDPVVTPATEPVGMRKIATKIATTEAAVLDGSRTGDYQATVIRYPYVYGPYAVVPMEWHIIKRCLDGRRRWAIRDGGLALTGRCASPNAAAVVAAVIDQPHTAASKIYHAADDVHLSQREWIEAIAAIVGHEFEFVDIPAALAPLDSSCVPLAGENLFVLNETDMSTGRLRHHVPTTTKAREELGYRQVVDPLEWMHRTVTHQLAHPPPVDGTHPSFGPLDFDYHAEDQFLDWWDSITANAGPWTSPVVRGHPYEHPKPPDASPTR